MMLFAGFVLPDPKTAFPCAPQTGVVVTVGVEVKVAVAV
jgi:hypothetical protein